MIRLTPDVGKNRLLVEFSGRITPQEVTTASQQLREATSRLRRPFDVVSDVRALESASDAAADLHTVVASVMRPSDVRHLVRVVGKSAEGALQLERLMRKAGFHAHLAFSYEEAEALLDSH